jgi:hypothetical protein
VKKFSRRRGIPRLPYQLSPACAWLLLWFLWSVGTHFSSTSERYFVVTIKKGWGGSLWIASIVNPRLKKKKLQRGKSDVTVNALSSYVVAVAR